MPAPTESERRYVTTDAAADYLGVSKKTVRRWIDEGRLTGYRVGPRYIRVDLDDVETRMIRRIPTGRGDDAE